MGQDVLLAIEIFTPTPITTNITTPTTTAATEGDYKTMSYFPGTLPLRRGEREGQESRGACNSFPCRFEFLCSARLAAVDFPPF